MRLHRELAIVAASLTLFVGAHFISAEVDALTAQMVVEPPSETQVAEVAPEVIEPVVSVEEPEMSPEEEELILSEDERIEAALIQQGYYRTDIPLSFLEQDYLRTACEEFGIDYFVMVALVEKETNFRNISGDGGNAVGYCQIWPKYWSGLMKEIGAEDLTHPMDNFRTSAAILAQHLERYGNMRDALTCYNTGKPGRSQYASDVLSRAEEWRESNG